MSQVPFDPSPLSVVPLPQQPEYASLGNSGNARPAVLTFVGVLSLTFGSISIIAGLLYGLINVGFVLLASGQTTPSLLQTSTSSAATNTAERLPSDGLPMADRTKIASDVLAVRTLSTRQLLQLDEMLAEHGKSLFGVLQNAPPVDLSRTTTSGTHAAADGSAGVVYFVLGRGRLEISDDHAGFFPADPEPAIRTYAFELPFIPVTAGSPAVGLDADQIRSTLRTIQDLSAIRLNTAQVNTLVTKLQSPGQQLVVPTTGPDPAWQLTSAKVMSDGTLKVASAHGSTSAMLSINAMGSIIQSTTTSSTFNAMPFGMPAVSSVAANASLVLTFAQLGLAILLLIAGIMTLRNSPRGRQLHWIYIVLKIPIALLTAATSVWMWNGVIGFLSATTPGRKSSAVLVSLMMGALPAAVLCVYAIVLIFMLRTRSANRFYNGG